MKEQLKKVANFLQLLDSNQKLSVTNLAVYIVLFKIATAQDFNLVDAGALFVALLNYSGKKVINHFSKKKEDAVSDEMNDLKLKLRDLQDKIGSVAAAAGINSNKLR